jgi:hypothetical protein
MPERAERQILGDSGTSAHSAGLVMAALSTASCVISRPSVQVRASAPAISMSYGLFVAIRHHHFGPSDPQRTLPQWVGGPSPFPWCRKWNGWGWGMGQIGANDGITGHPPSQFFSKNAKPGPYAPSRALDRLRFPGTQGAKSCLGWALSSALAEGRGGFLHGPQTAPGPAEQHRQDTAYFFACLSAALLAAFR